MDPHTGIASERGYTVIAPSPAKGWTAWFVALTFGGVSVTTEVVVTPDGSRAVEKMELRLAKLERPVA